jgi:hypothetical protein
VMVASPSEVYFSKYYLVTVIYTKIDDNSNEDYIKDSGLTDANRRNYYQTNLERKQLSIINKPENVSSCHSSINWNRKQLLVINQLERKQLLVINQASLSVESP